MRTAPIQIWLIPLLPLVAGTICALLRQTQKKAAFWLAVGSMGISTLLSLNLLWMELHAHGDAPALLNFTWLTYGTTDLKLGFLLNPLTTVMVSMVSFVSLLIFIYSHGYMHADKNYARFFCFLSLFAAGMLGLCVSNSLLLLFVSWELVGLCSYLLIGFWYFKPSAAAAAKKAFIVTKLGDMGFFIGILWLYNATGTQLLYDNGQGILEQTDNLALVTNVWMGMNLAGVLALLIFCGAVGKSGQFPLHVWLPDAMEGPTPVSALIHAATMVAAGVFLVGRMYPLFQAEPISLEVVTWIGAFTALMAATMAVAQRDIKRILAYSTVSQLGFMMLGLGVGGFVAGIFHLITHAFFKALLFLGSGSVIHGCHEEQDVFKMGGLKKAMPTTYMTYMIGYLALAGFPFLSGWWSKDEILQAVSHFQGSPVPLAMALAAAFLTAFYMTRQVCLVFFGEQRSHDYHPHESPAVMTVPLILLAVGAALLGFIGIPGHNLFHHFLAPHEKEHAVNYALMFFASLIPLVGIGLGWMIYGKKPLKAGEADPLAKILGPVYRFFEGRWYFDEIYEKTVVAGTWLFARSSKPGEASVDFFAMIWGYIVKGLSWCSQLWDEYVINGSFDAGCRSVRETARSFASALSGHVSSHLASVAAGVVLLFGIYLLATFGLVSVASAVFVVCLSLYALVLYGRSA